MSNPRKSIRNPWIHPAAHESDLFDSTTGHARSQDEIVANRKKKGLCPKCGVVKTHKRGAFGLVMSKDTRVGQVYKGICLQCHTLHMAKIILNEPIDENVDRSSVLGPQILPSIEALQQSESSACQSQTMIRRENSNHSSSCSGINNIPSSPAFSSSLIIHNQDEFPNYSSSESRPGSSLPLEISPASPVNRGIRRDISEITIPVAFRNSMNDRNDSNYIENNPNLVDINGEEQRIISGNIPTSTDLQSHGSMSYGGSLSRPGVVHFDGSSETGHRPYDRFQQRILENFRSAPPSSPSSSTKSSTEVSALASAINQNRNQSEKTTSPTSSTSTASHVWSKASFEGTSPRASSVSPGDQSEVQRQKKIAQNKSSGSLLPSRADEDFNRRNIAKVCGEQKGKTEDKGDEDSKPRVTHASGKGSSIYMRKMTDDARKKHPPAYYVKDEKVSAGESQLDEATTKELIEKCRSCSDLFDFLKKNSPLPEPWVPQTFIRMRNLLPLPFEKSCLLSPLSSSATSGTSDNSIRSFSNDWPNHLFAAMSSHPSDEIVQAEGFRTIWAIISTNNLFSSELSSYAEKKDIMQAMETHKKSSLVQGCGAGLIACIAATEKYARRLLSASDSDTKFIKRLMDALKFHYGGGELYSRGSVQENALKALYRLSSASLASSRAMVFFGKKMGHCAGIASSFENNPSILAVEAVLHAMNSHLKNTSVQIYGNRLLCNIFSFKEIDDEEKLDKWITEYLKYMMAAMNHIKSLPFYESAICLLSKISFGGCASLNGDLFPGIISEIMSLPDSLRSPLVAQHGCRCFYGVCARDSEAASASQEVFANLKGIQIIISCMKQFSEHQSIQSEACLALLALCLNCSTNKAIVLENGGIENIFCAFQSYSSSEQFKGVGLVTKIRACTALISLALDPASKNEIKNIGIINKFQCLLEENEKMPVQLSQLVQRLLVLTADEENDNWLSEFKESSSEDETYQFILAILRMIIETVDENNIDISSLIPKVLRAMRKFPMSKAVQENACKVLACVYSSYRRQAGREETCTEVLEYVGESLKEHKDESNVVAAACSVIRNICITHLTTSFRSSQILSDTLYASIFEVANAMGLCVESKVAVEQASGALLAMCNAKPSLIDSLGANNPGTSNAVRVFTDAMNKFPDSIELYRNAIGVLSLFFAHSKSIIRDRDRESLLCVKNVARILANFINESEDDDEEATTHSLQILKLLGDDRGHDSRMALSENNDIITAVVNSMVRYPDSLLLQGTACDILRSLSINKFKKSEICQLGGTTRVISALKKERMNTDSIFVCKALKALEILVIGADVNVLTDNETPTVLFNAIQAFPQCIHVQLFGASVIWHLVSEHNSFKDALVRLGAARLISEAMTRFLPSQDMQQRGFVTIWSLATQKELSPSTQNALKCEVGKYAIEPIINGLSAHCYVQNEDRQKFCCDGLGAVRCLSTSTSNKRVLEENGAINLICRILWLHNDSADLCRSALTALENICIDLNSNQVLQISSDVVDAVVNTMRTHQSERGVQSVSINILRSFTFSPSNYLILQRNALIPSLVNNAMVNFNLTRAEDVLRVFPVLHQ